MNLRRILVKFAADFSRSGVIYSSIATGDDTGGDWLERGTSLLLSSREVQQGSNASVLLHLTYQRCCNSSVGGDGNIWSLGDTGVDLAFDDVVLQDVRRSWQMIVGEEDGFLQFEDREVGAYDDDEQ